MVKVNAKDYGLVSGKCELQHMAIQKAIDDCFLKGGGEVVIPKGEYTTGDVRLRSNITLRLESGVHLMGSRNPEDYFNYLNDKIEPLTKERITDAPYVPLKTIQGETEYRENQTEYRFRRLPGSRWNNAIIRAIDATNIKIIGERDSVIDGMNCYDPIGEEDYRGPHGMTLYNCSAVELRGYTIQQTGNWAHWLLFSQNIIVDGVQVLAGHDGIDIFDCTNVIITNTEFYTGDDCVAGFGNINVYIAGCVFNSSCSAMRFGATNALIEKCRMYGPGKYCFRGSLTPEERAASSPSVLDGHRNNMLSAFTYYADYSMPIPATPGNIVISDCVFENANRFMNYNFSGNHCWQRHRPLDLIEFRNIKAKNVCKSIDIYGKEGEEIAFAIKNSEISVEAGVEDLTLIRACNYKRIDLENVSISGNIECLVKKWSDGDITLENVECDAEEKIVEATEKLDIIPF